MIAMLAGPWPDRSRTLWRCCRPLDGQKDLPEVCIARYTRGTARKVTPPWRQGAAKLPGRNHVHRGCPESFAIGPRTGVAFSVRISFRGRHSFREDDECVSSQGQPAPSAVSLSKAKC